MKPVILITPSIVDGKYFSISSNYTDAIKAEGGIPIVCTYNNVEEIEQLVDMVDGILLSGGGDINPDCYNEPMDSRTYKIYDNRDEYELILCKKAMEKNKPILGICRGIQLLNVCLGGTLKQHIDNHDVEDSDGSELLHDIKIKDDSFFAKYYNSNTIGVNSLHHQAIDKIGEKLEIMCATDDDIIEGVKHVQCNFVVAVQYHPEILYKGHEEHRVIFKEFIKACNVNRKI